MPVLPDVLLGERDFQRGNSHVHNMVHRRSSNHVDIAENSKLPLQTDERHQEPTNVSHPQLGLGFQMLPNSKPKVSTISQGDRKENSSP